MGFDPGSDGRHANPLTSLLPTIGKAVGRKKKKERDKKEICMRGDVAGVWGKQDKEKKGDELGGTRMKD